MFKGDLDIVVTELNILRFAYHKDQNKGDTKRGTFLCFKTSKL